jgi:hypothetical protein
LNAEEEFLDECRLLEDRPEDHVNGGGSAGQGVESGVVFLPGKNSVLQGVAASSFPFWHSSRAISSVRSGFSWQMRERDFLPLISWEMVP